MASRRPPIGPPPDPNRQIRAYSRFLEQVAVDAYKGEAAKVTAAAKGEPPPLTTDADQVQTLAVLARKLLPIWEETVEANGEHWEQLIPIPPGANGLTDAYYSTWIRQNTDLITRLMDGQRARARATVGAAVQAGTSYRDLTAQIQEDLDVGKSRARLIARDQLLKASSQITQAHHAAAGVRSFRWVANQDERTRPLHRAINGQIYTYPNGHPSEGVPGTHFQCRCFAYPIIPGVTDDEETADMIGGNLDAPEATAGQNRPPIPMPGPRAQASTWRRYRKAAASPLQRTVGLEEAHAGWGLPPEAAPLASRLAVVAREVPGLLEHMAANPAKLDTWGVQAIETSQGPAAGVYVRPQPGDEGPPRIVVAREAPAPRGPAIGHPDTWSVTRPGVPQWVTTAIHETGHHLHLGDVATQPARLVEARKLWDAYLDAVEAGKAPPISTYAASSSTEMVAEAFTAYTFHRQWLVRNHPGLAEYVEALLKHRPQKAGF